jgi:hypothetical protein
VLGALGLDVCTPEAIVVCSGRRTTRNEEANINYSLLVAPLVARRPSLATQTRRLGYEELRRHVACQDDAILNLSQRVLAALPAYEAASGELYRAFVSRVFEYLWLNAVSGQKLTSDSLAYYVYVSRIQERLRFFANSRLATTDGCSPRFFSTSSVAGFYFLWQALG